MIVASEAATLSSQVIHPARVAKNCNLAALSLASTVLSLAVQNLALTALSLASTDSLHLFVEQLATNLAWTRAANHDCADPGIDRFELDKIDCARPGGNHWTSLGAFSGDPCAFNGDPERGRCNEASPITPLDGDCEPRSGDPLCMGCALASGPGGDDDDWTYDLVGEVFVLLCPLSVKVTKGSTRINWSSLMSSSSSRVWTCLRRRCICSCSSLAWSCRLASSA